MKALFPKIFDIFLVNQFLWVISSLLHLNITQILKINSEKKDIDSFEASDFELVGYDPHSKIEMKMAV